MRLVGEDITIVRDHRHFIAIIIILIIREMVVVGEVVVVMGIGGVNHIHFLVIRMVPCFPDIFGIKHTNEI